MINYGFNVIHETLESIFTFDQSFFVLYVRDMCGDMCGHKSL